MRPKSVHLPRVLVWHQQIVGVETLNELAARYLKSGVAGRGHAHGDRADVVYFVRMIGGERAACLLRVIRRSVVNDDDFDRAIRLREHAVNGLGEQARAIANGNNRRDQAGPQRLHE